MDQIEALIKCLDEKFSGADLHTHLLGMGNWKFWIEDIMKTHLQSRPNKGLSFVEYYGPCAGKMKEKEIEAIRSLWKKELPSMAFVCQEFHHGNFLTTKPIATETLEKLLPIFLKRCAEKDKFRFPLSEDLYRHVIGDIDKEEFIKTFESDVVFDVATLAKALGVDVDHEEKMRHDVAYRLGSGSELFQGIFFFDAREQKFDFKMGITNQKLLELMKDNIAATAQIKNCFTMLNVDGSPPSNTDILQRYVGHFTPEFYPRRFVLKDCIYSQDLTVLSKLIRTALENYRPHVTLVEFQVGLKDLLSPWVYKHLVTDATNEEKLCYPLPRSAKINIRSNGPKLPSYCFLLGLQRTLVRLPFLYLRTATVPEALQFLLEHPEVAVRHALNRNAYSTLLEQCRKIRNVLEFLDKYQKEKGHLDDNNLKDRLVGLDWMSDELGFPYCPFMLDEFLDLARTYRLGFRVHCGEGVLREKSTSIDSKILQAMWAHTYIMMMAIRRIKEHGIPCRIGHGVALLDCLHTSSSFEYTVRQEDAASDSFMIQDPTLEINPFLSILNALEKTVIEVNLTSNSYLVEKSGAENSEVDNLIDSFSWFLCTDDDGVWGTEKCKQRKEEEKKILKKRKRTKELEHPNHQLVAAEYCNAIYDKKIRDQSVLIDKGITALESSFCYHHHNGQSKSYNWIKYETFWSCKFSKPRPYVALLLAFLSSYDDIKSRIIDEEDQVCVFDGLNLGIFLHFAGFFGTTPKSETDYFYQIKLIEDLKRNIYINRLLELLNSDDLSCDFIFKELQSPSQDDFYTYLKHLLAPLLKLTPCDKRLFDNSIIRTLFMGIDELLMYHWRLIEFEHFSNFNCTTKFGALDTHNLEKIKRNMDPVLEIMLSCLQTWLSKLISNDNCSSFHSRLKLLKGTGRSEMEYGPKLDKLPEQPVSKSKVTPTVVIKDLESAWNKKWSCQLQNFKTVWTESDLYLGQNGFFVVFQLRGRWLGSIPTEDINNWATDQDSRDWPTFTSADRVPRFFYLSAVRICEAICKTSEYLTGLCCLAGIGSTGCGIALIAAYMLAHQKNRPISVWLYGGTSFGTESLHAKIEEQCRRNLTMHRWVSFTDPESAVPGPLFRFCPTSHIAIRLHGPPYIPPWGLSSEWHYFSLFQHHLTSEIIKERPERKEQDMAIYVAGTEREKEEEKYCVLLKNGYSLYMPELTRIYLNSKDIDHKDFFVNNCKGVKVEQISEQSYQPNFLWCWKPGCRLLWKEIFHQAPLRKTVCSLLDLVLAIESIQTRLLLVDFDLDSVPVYQLNSINPNDSFLKAYERMIYLIENTPYEIQDPSKIGEVLSKYIRRPDKLSFMSLSARRDLGDIYILLQLKFGAFLENENWETQSLTYIGQLRDKFAAWGTRNKHSPPTIRDLCSTDDILSWNLHLLVIVIRIQQCCNPFLDILLAKLEDVGQNSDNNNHKDLLRDFYKFCVRLCNPIPNSNQGIISIYGETQKQYNHFPFQNQDVIQCECYDEHLKQQLQGVSHDQLDYSRSRYLLNPKEVEYRKHLIDVSLQKAFHSNFLYRYLKYCVEALPCKKSRSFLLESQNEDSIWREQFEKVKVVDTYLFLNPKKLSVCSDDILINIFRTMMLAENKQGRENEEGTENEKVEVRATAEALKRAAVCGDPFNREDWRKTIVRWIVLEAGEEDIKNCNNTALATISAWAEGSHESKIFQLSKCNWALADFIHCYLQMESRQKTSQAFPLLAKGIVELLDASQNFMENWISSMFYMYLGNVCKALDERKYYYNKALAIYLDLVSRKFPFFHSSILRFDTACCYARLYEVEVLNPSKRPEFLFNTINTLEQLRMNLSPEEKYYFYALIEHEEDEQGDFYTLAQNILLQKGLLSQMWIGRQPIQNNEQKITFIWYEKGNQPQEVLLRGSFSNWQPLKMEKTFEDIKTNEYLYECTILLKSKTHYQYQFRVDGKWRSSEFGGKNKTFKLNGNPEDVNEMDF